MSDFEALPPVPVTFTIANGDATRTIAQCEVPGESMCRWWKVVCDLEDGSTWETHVFPSLTRPRVGNGASGCKRITVVEVEVPS